MDSPRPASDGGENAGDSSRPAGASRQAKEERASSGSTEAS
jgi:hypothetical protein